MILIWIPFSCFAPTLGQEFVGSTASPQPGCYCCCCYHRDADLENLGQTTRRVADFGANSGGCGGG